MEIKEKLDTFFEAAIETAEKQGDAILEDYKKIYQENLETYEKQKQMEQENIRHLEEARIRHDVNRQVSEQILILKKEYHQEAEQKKEQLFSMVEKKLAEYQKTPEYQDYLVRKINEAKQFAKDETVTIYLNQTDEANKDVLEKKTGCELTISTIDFMGGIRAVIRSKNVLIDESFSSKLAQEREAFSF